MSQEWSSVRVQKTIQVKTETYILSVWKWPGRSGGWRWSVKLESNSLEVEGTCEDLEDGKSKAQEGLEVLKRVYDKSYRLSVV